MLNWANGFGRGSSPWGGPEQANACDGMAGRAQENGMLQFQWKFAPRKCCDHQHMHTQALLLVHACETWWNALFFHSFLPPAFSTSTCRVFCPSSSMTDIAYSQGTVICGGILLVAGICAVSLQNNFQMWCIACVHILVFSSLILHPFLHAPQLATLEGEGYPSSRVRLLQDARRDMHGDVEAIVRLTESR